ncbi:hypothetical protein K493DRAFT_364737, partial [Basidiobolus meristosporus CBS 931.73]
RKTTLDVFADDSASVQATMYRMAELILKRFPEMTIFSPVTDFSGYITATIGRRGNKF